MLTGTQTHNGVRGSGGCDFYFKEKYLNSTDCVLWGLWPRIKSAITDLGPTEVQGEGKGSVVFLKFFPDWETEKKVNRILMLKVNELRSFL